MSSSTKDLIHFGPFEVTSQVFHTTPLSYALVNIKPLLPGHVLIVPFRKVQRLTDLTSAEVTDLFSTVQKVQVMLSRRYFTPSNPSPSSPSASLHNGSFNIAIQDGQEAGQTVPHLHCHIIPRTKDSEGEGDGIYERLQGEEGNVGGGLWDLKGRPVQVGKFPRIEDSERKPRSEKIMREEADLYRELMRDVE